MRNQICIVTILIFQSFISTGCINEYRTLISGKIQFTDMMRSGIIYTQKLDENQIRRDAEKLYEKYLKNGDIEDYSDYATQLIYLKEYEKAKKIYKEIESKEPGRYITASNLGTIYELEGKPDSALIWIKESIKINPKSHNGSEWIHINILENKISKNKDENTSILNLDFGNEIKPKPLKNVDQRKIMKDIYHQLKERLKFIKPPNEIVGNIYFDYGNLLALEVDLESALDAFEESKKFGFNSPILKKRVNGLKNLTEETSSLQKQKRDNKKKEVMYGKVFKLGIIISICMIILPILVMIMKWMKKN